MRADRAYIAGFGTTGVLVASAVLLLAVVGTLVAYRWDGGDAAEDIGNLIVGESERPLVVQGPARIAREAAPAAGAVAETAAPGTAAAASTPAPRTTPGPTRPGGRLFPPLPPDDLGPPDPTPDPPPDPPDPPPDPAVSAGVQRVTSGLGDTTQGLTDGVGQTVGGLSPPLGQTLVDTGQLLADLLRALGRLPR